MSWLDLPADMDTDIRDAARAATLSAARAFGFGGDTWHTQTPSGIGMGARTLISAPDVTLLAFRQAPGPLGVAGGGTPILSDVWRGILIAGSLRPGAVITSAEDSRYVFGVASIEPWYDYARCDLERRR